MFLLCAAEDMTGLRLHWRELDTPFGRSWSALSILERPTEGTASGLLDAWPTPSSATADQGSSANSPSVTEGGWGVTLIGKVIPDENSMVKPPPSLPSLWSTPSAAGFEAADIPKMLERRKKYREKYGNNGFGLTLNQQVKFDQWQTPSVADVMGGHLCRSGNRSNELLLKGQVYAHHRRPSTDCQINGNETLPPNEAGPSSSMVPRSEHHSPKAQTTETAMNWPTPHGMGNDNNPRANGPTGNELGNAVMRSWPTPSTMDSKGCHDGQQVVDRIASGQARQTDQRLRNFAHASWPTPAAQDANNDTLPPSQANRKGGTLPSFLLQLNGRQDPESHNTDRSSQDSWPTPRAIDGRPKGVGNLNSQWVAQLQGLPANWCELPTETLRELKAGRTSKP